MIKNFKTILLLSIIFFSTNYSADLKVEAEKNVEIERKKIAFRESLPSELNHLIKLIDHYNGFEIEVFNNLRQVKQFLFLLVRFINYGETSWQAHPLVMEYFREQYSESYASFFKEDLKNFLTESEIDELISYGKNYRQLLEGQLDKCGEKLKISDKEWYSRCYKLIILYQELIQQAEHQYELKLRGSAYFIDSHLQLELPK